MSLSTKNASAASHSLYRVASQRTFQLNQFETITAQAKINSEEKTIALLISSLKQLAATQFTKRLNLLPPELKNCILIFQSEETNVSTFTEKETLIKQLLCINCLLCLWFLKL